MKEVSGATMSQKEAVEYLNISLQSFIRMEEAGIVTRLDKLPGARYATARIIELAGGEKKTYGQIRAEKERDEARQEAQRLREKLQQIASLII